MRRKADYYLTSTTPVFDKERGERLRRAMYKAGLDQKQLGAQLGVSQGAISKMITGKSRTCGVLTGAFLSALGPHFHYFMTGEGKQNYEVYYHSYIDRHGNYRTLRSAKV